MIDKTMPIGKHVDEPGETSDGGEDPGVILGLMGLVSAPFIHLTSWIFGWNIDSVTIAAYLASIGGLGFFLNRYLKRKKAQRVAYEATKIDVKTKQELLDEFQKEWDNKSSKEEGEYWDVMEHRQKQAAQDNDKLSGKSIYSIHETIEGMRINWLRNEEERQDKEDKAIYNELVKEFEKEWGNFTEERLGKQAILGFELDAHELLVDQLERAEKRRCMGLVNLERRVDGWLKRSLLIQGASVKITTTANEAQLFVENLRNTRGVQGVLENVVLNSDYSNASIALSAKIKGKWYFIETVLNSLGSTKAAVNANFSPWDCRVVKSVKDDLNTYYLLQCPELDKHNENPESDYREE